MNKLQLNDENEVTRLAAISDLFFNYDHPARDRLYDERSAAEKKAGQSLPGIAEYRAAILSDATDFAKTFQLATGQTIDPEALADDFLDRE